MSAVSRFVFKLKGKWLALIVVGLLLDLFMGFAVPISRETNAILWVIFCFGASIFLLLIGSIFLRSRLDIVVFPVRAAGASANVTAYSIRDSGGENGRSATRKIYFNDQSNDLSHLIDTLNIFIDRYQVKVERVSNGSIVVSHSL